MYKSKRPEESNNPPEDVKFSAGPGGKNFVTILITVCVLIAATVGVILVIWSNNGNMDGTDDSSFSSKLSVKPTPSLSSGLTPVPSAKLISTQMPSLSSKLTHSPMPFPSVSVNLSSPSSGSIPLPSATHLPTPLPTPVPTPAPTPAPSSKPMPSFNNVQIKTAVTEWYQNPADAEQKNGPIAEWPTSEVTSFSQLFWTNYQSVFFNSDSINQDLTGWDSGKVTSMVEMFKYARYFNGDVSSFDTSHVTDMLEMFRSASSFNGSLSSFDTSSVTSMARMFYSASSFNGDVSSFDTSRVISMRFMFFYATSFDQCLEWDVSTVRMNTYQMFTGSSGRVSLECV
eukprot:CAMPEP_0194346854 /NCGR_PEP_ID=MMETSP0171-20130528/105663_1 /TAXON_ID=218684 /ORGANISM="Corethron pennatum, Strain L29A3" /LENGTH=341 /DNA_ID=CAMNT_0039114035 /DNA_START=297 /DNA_END=1322 /DNA_ORIENTATION=-